MRTGTIHMYKAPSILTAACSLWWQAVKVSGRMPSPWQMQLRFTRSLVVNNSDFGTLRCENFRHRVDLPPNGKLEWKWLEPDWMCSRKVHLRVLCSDHAVLQEPFPSGPGDWVVGLGLYWGGKMITIFYGFSNQEVEFICPPFGPWPGHVTCLGQWEQKTEKCFCKGFAVPAPAGNPLATMRTSTWQAQPSRQDLRPVSDQLATAKPNQTRRQPSQPTELGGV